MNVLLRSLFNKHSLRVGDTAHGLAAVLQSGAGLPIDLCTLLLFLGRRLGVHVSERGAAAGVLQQRLSLQLLLLFNFSSLSLSLAV